MKLVHVTDNKDLVNIRKKGLVAGYESYRDTRLMGDLLNSFKPKEFPSYLDIRRCTWFTPGNTGNRYVAYDKPSELVVDFKKLDLDKLYFVDGRLMEKLKKLYESGASKKEKQELCKKYWQKLKPFSEYVTLFGHIEDLKRNIEVLYFDDIPPEQIEVVIGYTE